MSHDVIVDKYARLFEIPNNLARLGAKVSCLCLNYRINNQGPITRADNPVWYSVNFLPWCGLSYAVKLVYLVLKERPQLVIASSDILHIVIAHLVSRCFRLRFIADLYDNYESFGLGKMPILLWMYRRALRKADYILTVSDALNEHIRVVAGHHRVMTVESTIDTALFYKMDTLEARNVLGLVVESSEVLVGLCGALDATRGVQYIYEVFSILHRDYPNIKLVLAGNMDENLPIPNAGVIYLGRLKHSEMNAFFNAMDINLISVIPDAFGQYAFPQKAYEMAVAGKPCVVPDFGPMKDLFKDAPNGLYVPCEVQSIKDAIIRQLNQPQPPTFNIPTWRSQTEKINELIIGPMLGNDAH